MHERNQNHSTTQPIAQIKEERNENVPETISGRPDPASSQGLSLHAWAIAANDADLCVVPPAQDGTKRPLGTWRQFQETRPTRDQLDAWYSVSTRTGIGYVCGQVSGGLEVFEFDDADAWEAFETLIADHGLDTSWERVKNGYLERTPSGGYHVYWRTDAGEGNQKLASRPEPGGKSQVLIETRGQGGYVVAAPSSGRVHPTGGAYELLRGGTTTIAPVTDDERESFFSLARMLDETERQLVHAVSVRTDNERPGDRFTANTTWDALLPKYGWTLAYTHDDISYWRRPGKDNGISATTNWRGNDLLHVFTTSTPLQADRSYDRFGFYAVMAHGGDFSAAAAALSGGKRGAPQPQNASTGNGVGAQLVLRSLADVCAQPVGWWWERWLAQGKFHLLGGMAGDGKSTLAAAIAAIGSTAGTWPDGSPAPRFRTLFMLGEDALGDTLRPRLDLHGADLNEVLAVETVLEDDGRERFFNVEKHIGLLEQTVKQHAIGLVVIDPLTTIMPGRDRNAEGDVRDALTPLIKVAERQNVAVLGIVHVGKPTGTNRVAAQRILGATAFVAQARVVWQTAPVNDVEMALGVTKANLSMKPKTLLWSREEDGPVIWCGESGQSIDQLMGGGRSRAPRQDAEGFLREFLACGPQLSNDVFRVGDALGISKRTLVRAKEAIGVEGGKEGKRNGPWYWSLPGANVGHVTS